MRYRQAFAAAGLLLIAFGPAAPAIGQDATKTSASMHSRAGQPENGAPSIEMAFNPPIGQVLRFRVTKTKFKDGKPTWPTPFTTVEELRFERAGDGFILYWHIDPVSLPAVFEDSRLKPFLAPMITPFTGEPYAIDLDSSGEPLRVRDWAAAKARIMRAVDAALCLYKTAKPADRAALAKAAPTMRALFENMDERAAAQLLLDNMVPLLGWGRFDMTIGETRTGEASLPIALFHTSVKAEELITLVSVDPGRSITLSDETRVDPEALRGFVETFARQLGVTPTPTQKKELDALRNFSMTNSSRMVFDLPTGLPIVFEARRGVSGSATSMPAETRKVEWLR